MKAIAGTFILLHGLVHVWFFVLAAGLVNFKAEMGWTRKSWLLSGVLPDSFIQVLAIFLYLASTLLFVISAFGIWVQTAWQEKILLIAALVSTFAILLFFDGSFRFIIQKGLIGLVINLALTGWLLWH